MNVRILEGIHTVLKYAHRTDMEPKPFLTSDRKIEKKELTGFVKPFASKGLIQLTVKYVDIKRDHDVHVYVPGLRRIARVSGGNRCDCLGGFIFNMDDQLYFSGIVPDFNYELIEVKEALVPTLYPAYPEPHWPTINAHSSPVKLERREIWYIEQVPKDPTYCYGKRIFAYDPESRVYVGSRIYDNKGELWKYVGIYYSVKKNPADKGGGYVQGMDADDVVDFKIWEGGQMRGGQTRNLDLPTDLFTLDSMRRWGR